MSMYSTICYNAILPVSDFLLGQHVYKRLSDLRSFQWKPLSEIEAYRNERIRELVTAACRNVPYYSRVARELNIKIESIKSIEDLSRFPVLDKKIIREEGDELIDRTYRGKRYEMKSSGSTGVQTTVWADPIVMDEVFATQLLFWEWGGFQLGERHLQTGMSLNRGVLKKAKDLVFRCSYVSAFGLKDQDISKIVEALDRKKIQFLFGYASSIYLIAKYLESYGKTRPIKSIFTWGDSLFPHYREKIEKVFQCKVSDCYGLGEGLQCAAQCERHEGLHEAMHGVAVEILDSNGKACEAGQLGRVVVTRLESGCMPLIRYDTGDLACFLPDKCECGRELRLLSRIQGRSTDIVSTPSGDRLIVHFFTQLFEMVPEIRQFQIRQEHPDGIRVLFIPGDGFTVGILEKLKSQILENCTFPLRIDFESVQDIPLEKSNKRRFVISSVPI